MMYDNKEVTTLNPPREGTKLLILDIDRTIADFHAKGAKRENKTRPFLHSFLATLYIFYDIAIWSATDSTLIMKKIHSLGMWSNTNFRLLTCLDVTHMRMMTNSIGENILTKPLDILWDTYPQFDKTNTIMLDDKNDNSHFNPRNGLVVAPYNWEDYETDNDLLYLKTYLENIARYCNDFSSIDHNNWPYYEPPENHNSKLLTLK